MVLLIEQAGFFQLKKASILYCTIYGSRECFGEEREILFNLLNYIGGFLRTLLIEAISGQFLLVRYCNHFRLFWWIFFNTCFIVSKFNK